MSVHLRSSQFRSTQLRSGAASPSSGLSNHLPTPGLNASLTWAPLSELHQQTQWWRDRHRASSPPAPTPIDPSTEPLGPINLANSVSTAHQLAIDPLINRTSMDVWSSVGQEDRNDYYRFDLSIPTTLNLRLAGLPRNAEDNQNRWITDTKVDLLRQNPNGSLEVLSRTRGRGTLIINQDNTAFLESGMDLGRLKPGTYFLKVYRAHNNFADAVERLPYNLSVSTAASTPTNRFKIELDYRFDKRGFFNKPVRRATLRAAADLWENFINDNFPEVPAGTSFTVTNPESGRQEIVKLNRSIDDLRIYVGARSKPRGDNDAGGFSQPDGVDAKGAIFRNRIRGNKFEPWAGSIAFDTDVPWYFDPQPSSWDLPVGMADFYSIALHQIGHVLGIGTAPVFQRQAASGHFNGFHAKQVNNAKPIPLTPDRRHVRSGWRSNGQLTLMSDNRRVQRVLPTLVDRALLADLGYDVPGITPQNTAPAINPTQS